jgi:arylsulfatase A-like enzyme/cytochrome c-type biogenesis protein CcmH/NrfG
MHLSAARRFNRLIRFVGFGVSLVGVALAATPKAPPHGKSANIVLITLDTTRADRMGFLGSKRGATPNLDLLAKDSFVFTRAYAQSALTPPSHATILTGTYPQFHELNDMQTPLATDLPYAPQILHEHGYRTAAFVGAIVLEPVAPYAPGFERGFDTYDAGFHNEGPGEDRFHTVQRHGAEVVAHALAWLNKNPKGPFFIWIHLYDAHDPYDPPKPYKARYAFAPYDGGIAYEDAVVGKLLRQLKLRGLYEGSIIAVMADHGESLGAHGEDTHGVFLYDETIHVPLLIRLPHARVPGKRIQNRVELVDVLPTLLQQVGVAIPQEVQGESLLGLMQAETTAGDQVVEAWHDRPAYSQSEYPRQFGWSSVQSLRAEKYFYIQAPRRELYDDAEDPQAARNLALSSPAVADTLAGQLGALRQKTARLREAPKATFDPQAQAKLGALGYMASSGSESAGSSTGDAADPKDKIEIANMVHRAEVLQQEMHFDESIALLEQVLAKNPVAAYYAKMGDWLMRKRDFQKAVPVLRKSLVMNPDSDGARFFLAKALIALQDFNAAIPVLEELVARVPNAVEAHSFLELAYARTNRLSDAIGECKTVLQYDPEDYGSYLILGQSLGRLGDSQGGISMLEKAVSLQPADPTPHLWLAEIYDKSGPKPNADRERAKAESLASARPAANREAKPK